MWFNKKKTLNQLEIIITEKNKQIMRMKDIIDNQEEQIKNLKLRLNYYEFEKYSKQLKN